MANIRRLGSSRERRNSEICGDGIGSQAEAEECPRLQSGIDDMGNLPCIQDGLRIADLGGPMTESDV